MVCDPAFDNLYEEDDYLDLDEDRSYRAAEYEELLNEKRSELEDTELTFLDAKHADDVFHTYDPLTWQKPKFIAAYDKFYAKKKAIQEKYNKLIGDVKFLEAAVKKLKFTADNDRSLLYHYNT